MLVTLVFREVSNVRLNWAGGLKIEEPFIDYLSDSDSYFFHDELTRSYWRCKQITFLGVEPAAI
ncbi:hypothetical protein A6X21_11115 [Planctopirus hydrillae]|uniref:Uncharacterized protein n=1 Tax=Planctopirus hydrillae TaxID=1841610 RepID=A0A1C3E6C2_9PLAN|nr:hypothetical protein A6X21_11115 [Planctopirus hydrillae]